jgi:hypothetical protein
MLPPRQAGRRRAQFAACIQVRYGKVDSEHEDIDAVLKGGYPSLPRHKKSRRRRDAPIDKKCNLDRRIVVVCCPELERVRPVIVRGSTARPAQVHQ